MAQSSGKRYGIWPAAFKTSIATAGEHLGVDLNLEQIANINVDPGVQYQEIIAEGQVDRNVTVPGLQLPTISGSTPDLASFFASVSPAIGMYCNESGVGATLYYQQREEGEATFEATAQHLKTVAPLGFLQPTTLSIGGEGEPCSLDWLFTVLFDGTNDPVTTTSENALVGEPAVKSLFYRDRVYTNTTWLEGLLSATIDFGLGFRPVFADGDTTPRRGSIVSRMPLVTLVFDDMALMPELITNWFGANFTNDLTIFLKRGDLTGAAIRQVVANSIKFTISAGQWSVDSASVAGTEDGTISVSVRPTTAMTIAIGTVAYPV